MNARAEAFVPSWGQWGAAASAVAPGASAMITLLPGDEAGDAVTIPGEVAREKSTTLAAMLEGMFVQVASLPRCASS